MGVAGVILAAGESTRMGRDKALLPWPPPGPQFASKIGKEPAATTNSGQALSPPKGGAASETILSAAIRALSNVCDLVIVVAGKNHDALRPVVYSCGAFLVRN